MQINKPPPGQSPRIAVLMQEGDQLAQRMALIRNFVNSDAFKELPPLDAHLLTLQAETMQAYLHILTIRLARANDAEKGKLPDVATALGNKGVIRPN